MPPASQVSLSPDLHGTLTHSGWQLGSRLCIRLLLLPIITGVDHVFVHNSHSIQLTTFSWPQCLSTICAQPDSWWTPMSGRLPFCQHGATDGRLALALWVQLTIHHFHQSSFFAHWPLTLVASPLDRSHNTWDLRAINVAWLVPPSGGWQIHSHHCTQCTRAIATCCH